MDPLAFIAAIVQAMAWPLVVLVLVLVLRKEIKALLSRPMQHLKVGPVEATFGDMLADMKANVAELPPPAEPVDIEKAAANLREPKATTLKQLVRENPDSAVLVAHDLVYRRLQAITGQDFGTGPPLPATAASLARDALARGLITPETYSAIEGITLLRNLVAHSGPGQVTVNQAREYVAQVELILGALSNPPNK